MFSLLSFICYIYMMRKNCTISLEVESQYVCDVCTTHCVE